LGQAINHNHNHNHNQPLPESECNRTSGKVQLYCNGNCKNPMDHIPLNLTENKYSIKFYCRNVTGAKFVLLCMLLLHRWCSYIPKPLLLKHLASKCIFILIMIQYIFNDMHFKMATLIWLDNWMVQFDILVSGTVIIIFIIANSWLPPWWLLVDDLLDCTFVSWENQPPKFWQTREIFWYMSLLLNKYKGKYNIIFHVNLFKILVIELEDFLSKIMH